MGANPIANCKETACRHGRMSEWKENERARPDPVSGFKQERARVTITFAFFKE